MAEFNQQQSSAAPVDYTNSSRGIQASRNDAVGRLFSGLADSFEMGVKEQNRNIVENIQKDVFDEYDEAQAEFGVPEATDMEADPEEDSFAATPEGVTRSARQLESLHTAYQRGALKESHYWARMNSAVRQLRGKYPGYRDEIDRMVSGVTGATPANALRSALMREWNEESGKAGSEVDAFGKYVEWANKNGYLPSDYYDRLEAGNPYAENDLKRIVSSKTSRATELAAVKAEQAHLSEQGKLTTNTAYKNLMKEASNTVVGVLQDGVNAGGGFVKLHEDIRKAQNAIAAGDPLPQREIEKLKGMLGQLRTDTMTALSQSIASPWDEKSGESYLSFLDKTQIESAIEIAMLPITILEKALDSDDSLSVVNAVSAHIDAGSLDTNRELLKDIPVLQTMAAIQASLGSPLAASVLKLTPNLQVSLEQDLMAFYNAQAAIGGGKTLADEFTTAEQAGASPEYFQGIMTRWNNIIDEVGKGGLTPEILANNVNYMFGPGSEAIMAQIEPSSQAVFYDKVASPVVTRQIMALRDQGDVEAWETYRSFVATTFQAMFLQDVQSLQGLVTNDALQITWNDTAKQFDAKVTADPLTGLSLDTTGFAGEANKRGLDNQTKKLQNSLTKLNSAIRNVTPIVEDAGSDTSREVMAMLLEMGYDPDAPQAKGALGKLGNALKVMFGAQPEDMVLDDMQMRGGI